MEILIAALMVWISAFTGLPIADAPPTIKRVEARTMWEVYMPGTPFEPDAAPVALYAPQSRTMYLPEGFDLSSPVDLSILVHETTHHMQAAAGLTYRCRGEMEEVAYQAQIAFLKSMGLELFQVMPTTALGYKLITLCHIDGY